MEEAVRRSKPGRATRKQSRNRATSPSSTSPSRSRRSRLTSSIASPTLPCFAVDHLTRSSS